CTSVVYRLSLHDALPISGSEALPGNPSTLLGYAQQLTQSFLKRCFLRHAVCLLQAIIVGPRMANIASTRLQISNRWQTAKQLARSEEHTSELQSRENIVC